MSSPLLSLPPELLIAILRNLPLVDVYRCEGVCTSLRTIIKASSDLQYAIALEAECYDDVPSAVGFSEKLERLRRGTEAWRRQKTAFVKDIEVKHNVSGIYDLAGGVYLLGDISKHSMFWLRLPEREEDEVIWNSFKVPESIIDIGLAIDEHDLSEWLIPCRSSLADSLTPTHEISMYFYQLTTGTAHPDAAHHRLVVHRSEVMSRPAIGIEIVGDNLVLILSDYRNRIQPDDRLYIYEWKTGKLKMSLVAPYRSYSGPLFLTEELVVLPNAKDGVLEVWKIPRRANLPSPSAPFVILQLPTLAPGRQYASISCRGEPNPVGESTKPGSRIRERSYQANAENAVMIFNVNIEPSQNPFNIALGHMYTFFVHRKSLITSVEEADKRRQSMTQEEAMSLGGRFKASDDINIPFPSAIASSITVPWQEWGPPVTRWLEAERFPTRWITTTAGQRAILTNLPTVGGTNLLVFDFNPYHIRRTAWDFRKKRIATAEAMAEEERCRQKGKGKMVEPEDEDKSSDPDSPVQQMPGALSQDEVHQSNGYGNPPLGLYMDLDDDEEVDDGELMDFVGAWVDDDSDGMDDDLAGQEEAEEEEGDEGDDDDAHPPITLAINLNEFPHLPPGIIPFLLGHPNGLTLAQHINDLQEANMAGDNPGDAGALGHLGEVVGEGSEAMPGGWSESHRAHEEEESDEEDQKGLRTSIVFQKTQVDKYGRSFESPVVSHLPFVQIMTWIEERYEGVLMDEERLLGISVSRFW
ncbi:hypothetical protein BKA70DRAFT_1370960 [Coprinopsis sp. MPI-PUGE-AT-0042]|nr:hypothetical protein BKA70DRAFT_1370960 [Coprinopsis sp. MPI-PUGE-AT-0042]